MATGSILEINTKITSQIFCETIVSALRGIFMTEQCQRIKHAIKRVLMWKRLSNEKVIEIDLLADDRNVSTIL